MKKKITLLTFMITSAIGCFAQRNKVTYEFPPEMSETVKADYIKMWEKGKTLYGLTCAKCHNTVEKRREIIPDFKPEQLIGYELRVKNAQHETNMPDELVSAEELGLIMTFLNYKKKNK